jgi:DNA repair protein RecN (Recombination protein N)
VLTELIVRNLGVIEEMDLILGDGMTAVTGETGAGKTLVVGAIDLLTGGRAAPALVGPVSPAAEVEGRFVTGDREVVLRRVIPADGRSRAYIDGHLATAAALEELGRDLVDLHGQHTHQSLLRGPIQRSVLDSFGAVDTAVMAGFVDELRAIDAGLIELGGDARARFREIDLLRHQLSEIDGAGISDPGEDERLDRDESVLADAAAHRQAAAHAMRLLSADSDVSDGLARAQVALAGREPFAGLAGRIAAASAEISDIAAEARACLEAITDDPAALAAVRERRQLLAGLRRKYGSTLQEVIDFGSETARRLDELEGYEQRAASLESRRSEVAERLGAEQARVRGERSEAAPRLAAAVESHLAGLAMGGARLTVDVAGDAGEKVLFRLAANPGHEPLRLGRVASGGELARTMLALRLVLTAGPETLVFDEVDAGVGGTAARAVGRSLAALSADHQVIVVTHLPQVSAYADQHLALEKTEVAGSTRVGLRTVVGEDRLVELSRMLSGSPESAAAMQHAEELLAAASKHRSR